MVNLFFPKIRIVETAISYLFLGEQNWHDGIWKAQSNI